MTKETLYCNIMEDIRAFIIKEELVELLRINLTCSTKFMKKVNKAMETPSYNSFTNFTFPDCPPIYIKKDNNQKEDLKLIKDNLTPLPNIDCNEYSAVCTRTLEDVLAASIKNHPDEPDKPDGIIDVLPKVNCDEYTDMCTRTLEDILNNSIHKEKPPKVALIDVIPKIEAFINNYPHPLVSKYQFMGKFMTFIKGLQTVEDLKHYKTII